ncbi:MAG TPA: tyrosine-type recombinase/integrase, partial [Candidatus Binataceae bacterium]|nr:tyrosine-type recombinase/integrase [Candidatus Binataceae bacterium]
MRGTNLATAQSSPGWDELIDAHLSRQAVERGLSRHSLEAYASDLREFHAFCTRHRIEPAQLDAAAMTGYLAELGARGYAAASQRRYLASLRGLARELVDRGVISRDPAPAVKLRPHQRALPRTLGTRDIELLLDAIDTATVQGLRDRAMLELCYACGLRVSELVGIQRSQVDLRAKVVTVVGKGSKERVVPLGRAAQRAVVAYLARRDEEPEASGKRPHRLAARSNALFISRLGRPLTRQGFFKALKRWASTDRRLRWVSPHTLRHSF